jgi:hypothetical protein
MLKRITIQAAKKLFCEGNKFIYVCPHKFRPEGPFSMAAIVCGKEYLEKAEGYRDHPTLWKGTVEKTAWALMYDNWEWCNASWEAGYYPHYYVEAEQVAA